MKSSECPVVKWSGKAKKTQVEKTFTITAAKLNSAAITFTTSGNAAEKNPVLDSEGGRQIGTIKAAPKSEWKKYTHEIEGYEEELVKDAYLEEGAYLIGPDGKRIERVTKVDGGKDIENYTVTVSKTKSGKIGSITYKAKAGSPYTGSRTIKFLYTYQPRNEDFEEEDQ
ncbi:MAG: hypothetical protein II966_00590, partial [Lachnospiraceae bacterium]|nr:hypothetical protein [Lachnospiraceae bacterium]